MERLWRGLFSAVFLGVAFLASYSEAAAQTTNDTDYASVISAADASLTAGQWNDALAKAQKAVQIDPNRFEAYYYAAIALLYQYLPDQADVYAQQAQARAPAEHRGEVDALLASVKKEKEVIALASQADTAQAAGQNYSAAVLYLKAFELDPKRSDLGQMGAKLSATLGETGKVARIDRELAKSTDPTVSAPAQQELTRLAPDLAKIWNDSTRIGWQNLDDALARTPTDPSKIATAVDAFNRATEAVPEASGPSGGSLQIYQTPYVGLVAAAAARNDRDEVSAALASGARNGLQLNSGDYISGEKWACGLGCKRFTVLKPILCDANFSNTIENMFGPQAAKTVHDTCNLEDKTIELKELTATGLSAILNRCFLHQAAVPTVPDYPPIRICICGLTYDSVYLKYSVRLKGSLREGGQIWTYDTSAEMRTKPTSMWIGEFQSDQKWPIVTLAETLAESESVSVSIGKGILISDIPALHMHNEWRQDVQPFSVAARQLGGRLHWQINLEYGTLGWGEVGLHRDDTKLPFRPAPAACGLDN